MLRKIITILSIIGLLLSLGAWAASYVPVAYSLVGKETEPYLFGGSLEYGAITCAWWAKLPPDSTYVGRKERSILMIGEHTMKYELYVPWIPRGRWTRGLYWVQLPLWIPATLFGTALWVSYTPLRRRRKRRKLDLCLKCGYDLRGSQERCPECGQPFAKRRPGAAWAKSPIRRPGPPPS